MYKSLSRSDFTTLRLYEGGGVFANKTFANRTFADGEISEGMLAKVQWIFAN
jgi:hypothetical protein